MQKKLSFLSGLILLLELGASENLIDPQSFQQVLSWCSPALLWNAESRNNLSFTDGILQISPVQKSKRNYASQKIMLDFSTADKFNVSFDYKSRGTVIFAIDFRHQEKQLDSYHQKTLSATSKWQTFKYTVDAPEDSMEMIYSFTLQGESSSVQIKNMKILPVELKKTGKNFMLGDKKCEAVYYKDTTPANTFYDKRAGQIIRSMIRKAGGELLPLRKAIADTDYKRTAIYIGKAAEDAGIICQTDYQRLKAGGCFFRIKSGKAGIIGKRPGGVPLGAIEFLRHSGIIYISQAQLVYPETLCVATEEKLVNPGIPFRSNVSVPFMDRLGYTDIHEFANGYKIGGYREGIHSGPRFLPYSEFQKTHPEFFAMQADGQRLRKIPGRRFDVHFCVSNKEAQKIIADRIIELFRSDLNSSAFNLLGGDGSDQYCRCSECSKWGLPGVRNILWVNAIAEHVAKEFPDRKIVTMAYVDTRKPPRNIKIHPNVLIAYCPYEPAWMNHFIMDHPGNEEGWQEIRNWEKLCPQQMAAFTYPVSYREILNMWPVFQQNYDLCRYFAEHHYKMLMFCGYADLRNAGQIPARQNFAALGIYILNRVMINPQVDTNKEIDFFMKHYYGSAASEMQRYFNLIMKEPGKRRWEQNCERIIRGFATPELCRKGLKIFEAAEQRVRNEKQYLERVQREKIYLLWHNLTDNCRGNGRIGIREFPEYAKRLGEFCRLAKKFKLSYFQIDPAKWFWETALLKISYKGAWYNAPQIDNLIKNPEKALGELYPNSQETTAYGFLISVQGITGGESSRSAWMSNQQRDVKILRRESSGLGLVQFNLKLEAKPQKDIAMLIEGIDNEKEKTSLMRILVNGNPVYENQVPWGKKNWSEIKFIIPASQLFKGNNVISIQNITPDTEKDGYGGINYISKRNYYWGWFMISSIKIYLDY